MIRLYFVVIMSVLIIIPHTVNTFFLQNVTNITVPRNLRCRLNNNQTSPSDFQLCAIRIYNGLNQSQEISFTLYNGLRYMNTFRRLIQKNCNNIVNMSQAGTGAWSCGARLPFESYINMQICVCANDYCNDNINTCQDSLTNSMNLSSSVDFIPNLTSIIQCNDTLNAPYICTEHPFINVSLCQDYIRNTSVLCAITLNNSMITQRSLIYENYETYLSEKVYQAPPMLSNASNNSFIETATNVYYKYIGPAATPVEECACTNSLCNQNITICASQTIITTSFTSTTTSPTTTTSSTSTTRSSSTSTTTSSSTPTTTSSSTPTTTSSSTPTTTSSSTSTTTSSSTSTRTSSTSTRTSSTSTTTTSTQQNSVQGETGLGSAATAGLACGIIFSALIFTGEIIFFKFFYSGSVRSG